MKVIHLISGGDSGGAKTHVLSLLQHLNETITAQLVCFRDGPFADEAREMGIPTEIMDGNHLLRIRRRLVAGEHMELRIWRDGTYLDVSVELRPVED